MKNFQEIQGALISKIRSTLPANISLADELADLLQVSSDSAYRRIRGETALTIEEITAICLHYKISFDALTSSQPGLVTFSYHEVNNDRDFIDYLKEMRDTIKQISQAPEKQIFYAAVDMPVFHYFTFPEYLYFKMFYWLRSVSNDPDYVGRKFRVSDLPKEVSDLCKELADLYCIVPSTEMWTDTILTSLLKQVGYYWQTGVFYNKEEAFSVLTAVRKSVEKVERESEMDMKLLANGLTNDFAKNFQLYQSDIEIGNNIILVMMGKTKILYTSFHTFNKMFTTNPCYAGLTEKWMNNLIRQANLISGVAEKQRFQFFQKLYSQLDALSDSIERDR